MLLNQRLNAWVFTFHNIFVRRVPCRKGPPPLSFDESQHLLRTRHNIRRHSFCKVEIWKSRLDWRSIGRHWLSFGRDNTLKLVHRADSRMTACWNLIFSAWDRVQANIRQVQRYRASAVSCKKLSCREKVSASRDFTVCIIRCVYRTELILGR